MKFSPETEKLIPLITHPCESCKYTNMQECISECKMVPVIPACPTCNREFQRSVMYVYVPLRMFSGSNVVMAMVATMSLTHTRVHRDDDTVYYTIVPPKHVPKMMLYCSHCFAYFEEGDQPSVDKHFFSRWNESKLSSRSAIIPRLADVRRRAKVNGL